MPIVLRTLELENFKCFEHHLIHFDKSTIMVGQNNAGKTTVVEALRILGLATARLQNANTYKSRPEWLAEKLPLAARGISISSNVIDADLEQVYYRYGVPPAIVKAYFSNQLIISIYIGNEQELFATVTLRDNFLSSKEKLRLIGIPNVRVLPQIVPLVKEEPFVTTETLRRNQFSKRISGNFRNNLLLSQDRENYELLQDMIAQTWGRLQINRVFKADNNSIYLDMRDGDFVTEIYYMGHGIQMWLQTLWFIVSSKQDAIVVLDEPDVYMHADLQRKLVRILKDRFEQMVIATHSIEIMSEVLPENILIINRHQNESILADGYPALQVAISGMGSVHNINLNRLLSNNKYLYVEGKDIGILSILYDKVFTKNIEPFDHLPCIPTGGWGGWTAQREHALTLKREIPSLNIFFLFDHDYHSQEEVDRRVQEAYSSNLKIHIWQRKEIENYLLIDTAIARYVAGKRPDLEYSVLCKEIRQIIWEVCNEFKDIVIDSTANLLCEKNRNKSPSDFFRKVRQQVEEQWETLSGILQLVPGKTVFGKISNRCKEKYNVSFCEKQIANAMEREEISDEVVCFLQEIKNAK